MTRSWHQHQTRRVGELMRELDQHPELLAELRRIIGNGGNLNDAIAAAGGARQLLNRAREQAREGG